MRGRAVLFVVVAAPGAARGQRRRHYAAALYAAFAGAAGYLGWRFGRLAGTLHERWLPDGNVLMSAPYAAAMVAFIMAVWLALYVLLRKRFAAHSIALGAAFVLLLAAGVSSWFAVGASYVVTWPLIGSLLAAMAASSGRPEAGPGAGRTAVVMLLAVPAILILWPLVYTFFVAMGLAPEGGVAAATLTALAMGALAVPIEFTVERRRWWPAGIAATIALACLAVAVSGRLLDRHPRPASITSLDAGAGTANLGQCRADRPDAWFTQFLGASPRPDTAALVQPWSSVNGVPRFPCRRPRR
jgi:hypothetical protein